MNDRFHRILKWTPDDQGHFGRNVAAYANRNGISHELAVEAFGPPAPWPVVMTVQRLAWHGRTQEAFEFARDHG